MEVFVPPYEWNSHYTSVEEAVAEGQKYGDCQEGDEFQMVRLTVGALTTYKVVDGKAVPIKVAFPEGMASNEGK